jgi:hypothetical protein
MKNISYSNLLLKKNIKTIVLTNMFVLFILKANQFVLSHRNFFSSPFDASLSIEQIELQQSKVFVGILSSAIEFEAKSSQSKS